MNNEPRKERSHPLSFECFQDQDFLIGICPATKRQKAVSDLSSLDVIAEFEGKLDSNNQVRYYWMLAQVVNPMELATKCTFSLIHATAPQRLEALVRCLGLWK